MTDYAAVPSANRESRFSSLNDCFRISGARNECQLPANPKVSFRLSVGFHAVPVYVGFVSNADGGISGFWGVVQ